MGVAFAVNPLLEADPHRRTAARGAGAHAGSDTGADAAAERPLAALVATLPHCPTFAWLRGSIWRLTLTKKCAHAFKQTAAQAQTVNLSFDVVDFGPNWKDSHPLV